MSLQYLEKCDSLRPTRNYITGIYLENIFHAICHNIFHKTVGNLVQCKCCLKKKKNTVDVIFEIFENSSGSVCFRAGVML